MQPRLFLVHQDTAEKVHHMHGSVLAVLLALFYNWRPGPDSTSCKDGWPLLTCRISETGAPQAEARTDDCRVTLAATPAPSQARMASTAKKSAMRTLSSRSFAASSAPGSAAWQAHAQEGVEA